MVVDRGPTNAEAITITGSKMITMTIANGGTMGAITTVVSSSHTTITMAVITLLSTTTLALPGTGNEIVSRGKGVVAEDRQQAA